VNTVSENYRNEILTKNFGQDLHRILGNRQDRLFGIVNGIDYMAYNPENDPGLNKKYNYQKINLKRDNKKFLQEKLGLSVEPQTPLIALTSRVTFQKGFELIVKAFEPLSRLDMQMIIMGDGDKKYISEIKKIQKKFPKKICWIPFAGNENLETLIYAAADLFLLPSHHEPCGINQMIAMRYGAIPIVRRVGGLSDTVTNYNPTTNRGNGFNFAEFSPFSLYGAVVRALENFKHKKIWQDLTIKVMQEANSWELPAKKYINLYQRAIKNKS
jgi:starch synthase